MSILTMIGIGLGVIVIATDRFIHRLSHWLAIALFCAAAGPINAGIVVSRNAGLIK